MITGRGGSMGRGGRIRPPRRPMASSGNDDFEQCWGKLRDALRDIHQKNAGNLAFEQLYRYSYKIVVKKEGRELYNRVKEFEESWFANEVMPPIWSLITKNLVSTTIDETSDTSVVERRAMGHHFLVVIRASWENHQLSMGMISDILMYLDRGYSSDDRRPSIYITTMGLFRDHILRSSLAQVGYTCQVFDILNATIIDQVNMEREGDVIDKALLRGCISMLEGLYETDQESEEERLYLTAFEPVFIRTSHIFYKAECERLLRDGDARAWLHHTQRRIAEETDRCKTTLSRLSLLKILQVVNEELIVNHLKDFLMLESSGIRAMIDNDRIEDLSILYLLISRVDKKKDDLRKALEIRVYDLGVEIEQNLKNTDFNAARQASTDEPKDDDEKPKAKLSTALAQQTAAAIKWVDDVLALKDKFDRLWKQCFAEDLDLETALMRSFSDFVNKFDRSSEYVSLFIDENLRRGIKGKTEAEVDVVLDKAITLIRYLSEKDKFEQYYQKHLGRRLLHGRSESQEVEQEMISRMKRELGNNFTHKFEGMFKDMNLSKEITDQYRTHVQGLGEVDHKQIDLNISVLAGNNWPKEILGRVSGLANGGKATATYPREIERLKTSFFEFYSKNRNGRVLTYVGTAGTADIKCIFPKIEGKTSGPLSKERRYEINVSTYGMIVVMLFNDLGEDDALSFEEIQAATNIPEHHLVNVLTSLAVLKPSRILLRSPAGKTPAKPGDRFTFNREFFSKTIKIKVPSVNAANKLETDEERRVTNDDTMKDRMYFTDAAIVRIMKQRKELSHTQLVSEIIQVLSSSFKPDVPLIKDRLESLLSREYLERCELADGTSGYKYLA